MGEKKKTRYLTIAVILAIILVCFCFIMGMFGIQIWFPAVAKLGLSFAFPYLFVVIFGFLGFILGLIGVSHIKARRHFNLAIIEMSLMMVSTGYNSLVFLKFPAALSSFQPWVFIAYHIYGILTLIASIVVIVFTVISKKEFLKKIKNDECSRKIEHKQLNVIKRYIILGKFLLKILLLTILSANIRIC